MAMTAAQKTAELQRKKNEGILPTNQANMAEYNALTKQTVPAPKATTSNAGSGVLSVVKNTVPSPPKAPTTMTTPTLPSIPQNNPVPAPTAVQKPSSIQSAEYFAWKSKQDELYNRLEGMMNEKFEYNPETDPGYLAQRNLAKLRADDANKATMETMNDRGLLQSTVTNSQLDQNNQRAEQEAQAYIPIYRDQAYNQHQDRLRGARDMLDIASGFGNTAYERDYQTGRDTVGDAYNEAQLTGVYQSPEVRSQIDSLLALKRQAETKGITAEQRTALSKQADGIRSWLSSQGVDISQLGADTHSSKANAAAGVQTLAGKDQTYNQMANDRAFEFAREQYERGIFENDRGFNEDVRRYGLDYALQQKAQQLQEQNMAQDNARGWAAINLNREEFNYRKEQDKNKPTSYNYKSDPEFAKEVQWINNNPNKALQELKSKSEDVIAQYGKDGYDALIDYATPKKKTASDLISEFYGSTP